MSGEPLLHRFKHAPWTRPFWRAIAWPVALALFLRIRLVAWTLKLEVEGPGAAFPGPAVYVNWHRHLPFLLPHHGGRHRWLMISPAPYMEPIFLLCRWLGFRLVLGAAGEGGREALEKLVPILRAGGSVVIAVDGPAGPPFEVKAGCVELARRAGVPVVPVAYTSPRGYAKARRWDQMLFVPPFAQVRVVYGAPLRVQGKDSAVLSRVDAGLRSLDPECPPAPAGAARPR